MPADGYLMLGNAEQAEDSTKLFEVRVCFELLCLPAMRMALNEVV